METNQTCIYLFIHYFFRQSSRTNLRAVIKGHPQFVPRQLLPRAAFLLSLPLPLPVPRPLWCLSGRLCHASVCRMHEIILFVSSAHDVLSSDERTLQLHLRCPTMASNPSTHPCQPLPLPAWLSDLFTSRVWALRGRGCIFFAPKCNRDPSFALRSPHAPWLPCRCTARSMPSPGLTLDVVGGLLLICNHIVCFVRLPSFLFAFLPLPLDSLAVSAVPFVSDSAATTALGFVPFHSSPPSRRLPQWALISALLQQQQHEAPAEAAASQDAITMGPRHFPVCQLVINGPRARPVRRRRCRLILGICVLSSGSDNNNNNKQPQQCAAADFVAS